MTSSLIRSIGLATGLLVSGWAFGQTAIPGCAPNSSSPVCSKFQGEIVSLADQLVRNVSKNNANASFLISSFTNINNLAETTPLGRLMAENLMHELQIRAWRVYEPRLMQNFVINRNGEFTLSRDVRHLREQYGVTNVVAGTIAYSNDQLIINARVIDVNNGMVVSTGQIQMPASWVGDALLYERNAPNLKIIGG